MILALLARHIYFSWMDSFCLNLSRSSVLLEDRCHFSTPQNYSSWVESRPLGKLGNHPPFMQTQLLPELPPGKGRNQALQKQGLVTLAPRHQGPKSIHVSLKTCFFINETGNDVFENSTQKCTILWNQRWITYRDDYKQGKLLWNDRWFVQSVSVPW